MSHFYCIFWCADSNTTSTFCSLLCISDDREREVLWWAIEGIKAWSTTLHARLARDMMEAPGSGQRLTWPRLMQQLAFIHECDRYDYILGPEATDGQSRIMIKKCYR